MLGVNFWLNSPEISGRGKLDPVHAKRLWVNVCVETRIRHECPPSGMARPIREWYPQTAFPTWLRNTEMLQHSPGDFPG